MKMKLLFFLSYSFTLSINLLFCQSPSRSNHPANRPSPISHLELKWSEREVKDISKIFSGKTYLYDRASEENFKKQAPKAKVIHLATHAIIDDDTPLYSKFLFSPATKIEDGLLHTYELYNMKLTADLAVLSACRTGSGKLVNGEGIMSLARGFMYAGCPNVVVSLWQVDDKSTANIMKNFFREIKRGADKDAALTNAKLEYLKNTDPVKSGPFYWAGFILIGNSDPVEFKHRSLLPCLIGILILMLIFLGLIFSRKIFPEQHNTIIFLFPIFFLSFLMISDFAEHLIFSQQKPEKASTDIAEALDDFGHAQKLQQQAEYDSSIAYFEKASLGYAHEKDWTGYITCYNQIAENLRRKGEYDRALEYLNRAGDVAHKELDNSDPVMAQLYNMLGKVYRKKGEIDKAFDYFNKSLSISLAHPNRDSLEIATSYYGIGVIHYYRGDYDKSLEFHQKSLSIRLRQFGELHPLVADSYVNLGIISSSKGDFDAALDYYQRALAIRKNTLFENHPDIANSFLNLGALYQEKGDYDRSLQYFQQAIALFKNRFDEKHPAVVGCYMNIGIIFDKKGDYGRALEFYNASLSSIRDAAGETHPLVAQNYLNLGVIYKKQADYNKALEYYNRALSNYQKTIGSKHPEIIKLYMNIANVYSLVNDFEKALTFYQNALNLAREILDENHPLIAIIFNNMGIVYSTQAKHKIAQNYFNHALSLAKKSYGEKHPFVAEVYQQLAESFFKQNDFEHALNYYQRAIIALTRDFSNRDIDINPPLENISEETRLLSVLALKARTLENQYSIKTKNLKDLTGSFSTYDLALQLIDNISKSYHLESSKFYLREKGYDIYRRAVKNAVLLYHITHNPGYKVKAFAFAEKSKANVLRQAVLDLQAKKIAGIPGKLLEQERQLKTDLNFYNEKLFQEKSKGATGDSERIKLWQDKIFRLNREYESLINTYERDYPAYYNLKYQASIISPEQIQEQVIGDSSAIVEYFIGNDSLFIFTLTKEDFDVTAVKIDTSFDQLIHNMQSGLIKRNHHLYTTTAYQLYRLLIAPVMSKIKDKKLIIIPDGKLAYIPFETLLTRAVEKDQQDYRSLSYLIKTHQISYNYSSSLLFETMNRKKAGKAEIDYLGFAPVVFE